MTIKNWRPPRATLDVAAFYIGHNALRIEHRLCDAMFDIAQHFPSSTVQNVRSRAEARVLADLESEVRNALRPTQRDWKWCLRQRRGLAKQVFGPTFDQMLFEHRIRERAFKLMHLTMFRVHQRHANRISNIATYDLREYAYEWGMYSAQKLNRCGESHYKLVNKVAFTCWTVGNAVFGELG